MRATRRLIIVAAAALALAACNGKKAPPVTEADVVLGEANAPVTVIEYASVACPGCMRFHRESFPTLKTKYIDTGQAKFVLREMLTHNEAWAAAGFLMARCLGKDKYFAAIDDMYAQWEEIELTRDIKGGLLTVAKKHGMSEAEFDACVRDPEALEALNARVQRHLREEGVDATPTFIVNGREVPGTLDALSQAIEAAKAAPAAPASGS